MSSRGNVIFGPPNPYEFLFLPQGATNTTILQRLKTISLLCRPDTCGREDIFKITLQSKNFMEEEKARTIYDKYGIKKTDENLN